MEKRRSYKKCVFALLTIFALNTLAYGGVIYDFNIFNSPQYENDPQLNFTLTLTDEETSRGRQKVGFIFQNNSTVSSSITDIYFDARPDTGSSLVFNDISIFEGPGVSFSKYANPWTLPGGNMLTPAFDIYPEYSIDSDWPISPYGINPDEWLKLVFTLKCNRTIDDVISEIAAGSSWTSNSLRIGLYIQSLPNGIHYGYCGCGGENGGVSAINCTQTQQIPEPATITLLTLGGLVLLRRKSA
jgi:hypothetical protein